MLEDRSWQMSPGGGEQKTLVQSVHHTMKIGLRVLCEGDW